ncbi:hypothetical protein HAX54_016823, partial [Datura stramonium]|nr:hypothetical protein [Datura stramonium]
VQWVEEDVVNYRLRYDPKGLDVEKTKEPEAAVAEHYPLSKYSRALSRVKPGFEEPFDDDDPADDEQVRVDSDLESDANDGED